MAPTPACRCGHPGDRHPAELEEACAIRGCDCTEYLPVTLTDRPTPLAAAPVDERVHYDVEELLEAGRGCPVKSVARIAARIDALVLDLEHALDRHAKRIEAEAAIAKLEAELAAARDALKSMRHAAGLPGGERTSGAGQCPDCAESFDTAQRLGVHRRWHHGYRRGQP